MIEELEDISKLIGKTPVIKLKSVPPPDAASIFVKLEYTDLGGSHKDGIDYYMFRGAVEEGAQVNGGYVIEISSGNTATVIA